MRYLGVNVGKVARIRLDPRAADRVLALVDLDKATPVDAGHARPADDAGRHRAAVHRPVAGAARTAAAISPEVPSQGYPVIRSVPSDFDLFVSGLPELVADATRVTRRLNALLGDDNLAAVRAAVGEPARRDRAAAGATRDAGAAGRGASRRGRRGARGRGRRAPAGQRRRAGARHGAHAPQGRRRPPRRDQRPARCAARAPRGGPRPLRRAAASTTSASWCARAATRRPRSASSPATLREEPSRLLYEPPKAGVEIPR